MKTLLDFYHRVFLAVCAWLQAPLLLGLRLYFGWTLIRAGWGKLHHLARVATFFAGLGIPAPSFNAHFVAWLEFLGGILLALGLLSRPVSGLLAVDMLVAYWLADRDALLGFFTHPGQFTNAAEFPILLATVVVLIVGPGCLSLDAWTGVERTCGVPISRTAAAN